MMAEVVEDIEREVFTRRANETLLEKYDIVCDLCRRQADITMDLVSLIIQHKDVDDAAFEPIKKNIDEAAVIRAELDL
jgi:hypothetical protein